MVGTVEFALKPDLDEQHHDDIEKVAAILVRDNSMKINETDTIYFRRVVRKKVIWRRYSKADRELQKGTATDLDNNHPVLSDWRKDERKDTIVVGIV